MSQPSLHALIDSCIFKCPCSGCLWRGCSPVTRNNLHRKGTKRIQKLSKSKLTSVNASERPLSAFRPSWPEVCPALLLRFCNASELTGVNYSTVSKPRFVPRDVSSDSVDAFSPLPICPSSNEIQADIKIFLGNNKSDAIWSLSLSTHNLARKSGASKVKELLSPLWNQELYISDTRQKI